MQNAEKKRILVNIAQLHVANAKKTSVVQYQLIVLLNIIEKRKTVME